MRRESELRRRLASVTGLLEAISAMKSISAHHLREARRELEPARAYKAGLDAAVAQAGVPLPPGGRGAAGLLVIGADLGLCGGYNARIAERAVAARRAMGDGPTYCVGRRAALVLGRRGLAPTHTYAMPTGAGSITAALLEVSEEVLVDYFARGLSRVDLVAAAFRGVGAYEPGVTALLPVATPDAAPRRPGHAYASAGHVAEVAVRELLYISLYLQMVEALASEHGARLLATEAAEEWLRDRVEVLRRSLASTRREASTQETIEIASATKAVRRAAEARSANPEGPRS